MGIYRDRVLPRLVDRACGAPELQRWRTRLAEGLEGTIVEIGFGSGLNMASYPDEVTRVFAVDPALHARKIAEPRIAARGIEVSHIGLDGASIPLADDSCDGALCTFTLCTVPDVEQALSELRRVVRPGGPFRFLEHGLAPDESIARWQHRIEPVQKRLADGCHLTRDPVAMVRDAGFVVERSEARYATGPKPWTWFTEGFAINP